jgi:hypothetical protein
MKDVRRRALFAGALLVAAALLVLVVRAYGLSTERRTFYLLTLPAAPVHRPHEQQAMAARITRLLRFARIGAVVVRRGSPLAHFGEILSIRTGIPIDFRAGPDRTILKRAVGRSGRPRLYVFLRSHLPAWLKAVPRPLRHPILSLVTWTPFRGARVYSFEPSFVMTARGLLTRR